MQRGDKVIKKQTAAKAGASKLDVGVIFQVYNTTCDVIWLREGRRWTVEHIGDLIVVTAMPSTRKGGAEADIQANQIKYTHDRPTEVKWEYKSFTSHNLSNAALTRYGKEGWEIASTAYIEDGLVLYVLKRRVVE